LNFLDLAEGAARLDPDKLAVIDYSWGLRESYTYLDIERLSNNIASILEKLGISKGDRVSVLSYNNVEYLSIYMATIKKGAILAPLSWRASPKELAFMIDDVEPKVLFYHREFEDLLKKALEMSSSKPKVMDIEELRGLHKEELEKSYQKDLLSEEDVSMLLYTGGTTGGLKAAMIPYRQVIWNAINTVISWGLTPNDVAPNFFPFFHTGGWHVITIPLYIVRGTVVLVKKFDPDEAIEVIEREKCTVVIAVPTMFQMMSKSPKFKDAKFSSVRFFKSGGGMSPYELVKIYWDKGAKYFQGYGLTEAGPNLLYTPESTMKEKAMSVGKPGLFVQLKIVKEDGTEAKPGEIGELYVKGPITFVGYWKRPKETTDTITPDGWVKTGDLFTIDGDGYFYFVERRKFMIKTGGENVYPSEVEEAIRSHPGVDEVAVFGVPDPKWVEAVAAVIKPKPGWRITPEEIKTYLRDRIAGYKIPKHIWIVDEVPKTAVGKIDYAYLKRTYSEIVNKESLKL
jgi:fatty-acyl-CoA synthase